MPRLGGSCHYVGEKLMKQFLKKPWVKITISVLICLTLVGGIACFAGNAHVKNTTKEKILTQEQAASLTDVDCILVLGCGIKDDGTPTALLQERMDCGIALYQNKVAPKLLLTGDNGREGYNEVETMRKVATQQQVPAQDIFLDHAGFSTYESMYRAKEIFKAKKIVIVTQEYHLYRAIYIAQQLGLTAYGVACDTQTYKGQTFRDIREILARNKDAVKCIFKPEPTFLGETIPVSGDGTVTH